MFQALALCSDERVTSEISEQLWPINLIISVKKSKFLCSLEPHQRSIMVSSELTLMYKEYPAYKGLQLIREGINTENLCLRGPGL